MSEADPRLTAKKPISMLNKPLKAEFKPLFKALSKGITHVAIGKWEELGSDTVEALSALGLKTDPGELAFLLVQRSMTRALFLVGEINLQLVESEEVSDTFDRELDSFMAKKEFSLDPHFFDRPTDLLLLEEIKWLLKRWLETYGLTSASAQALVARLPKYLWKNYGALTGRQYESLPADLARDDLAEITAQPLLNYLVALSFNRDKLDFSQNVNLNEIYADLVAAVHERGYEKKRPYAQIRHMSLDNFTRVLEEIGLAAWHGDGRTTTVGEVEEHCRTSGVVGLLDAFQRRQGGSNQAPCGLLLPAVWTATQR
jgi:hypothetical protein